MTGWRQALAALAGAVVLLAGRAVLAQSGFWAGAWRGEARVGSATMLVELVVQPDGTYVETERSGSMMTMQSGQVRLPAAGKIAFTVTGWQPRTTPAYHALGGAGGFYAPALPSKPPGGVWRYRFTDADTVVLQGAGLGGSMMLVRVR